MLRLLPSALSKWQLSIQILTSCVKLKQHLDPRLEVLELDQKTRSGQEKKA